MSWLTAHPILGFIASGFVVFVTWMIALFVNYKFSPGLQLRLQGKWIDDERIILHIEVENKSQVGVRRKYVKVQIQEYPASVRSLSEWVPFGSDRVRVCEREPFEIFQSNHCLYPGEILSIDRIECLSAKDRLFHVGLQFKSKSSVPFLWFRILGHNEQWTTTAIFVR